MIDVQIINTNMELLEASIDKDGGEALNSPIDVFSYVEDFFKNNPAEYEKVKNILKQIITKLSQDSLNNVTFCDLFATPNKISDIILKILNISANQLAEGFYAIHFFKGNAMHSNPYYHVLLLLYYIGLKKDDQIFRLYCLTLIYIKLYNGRKIKYFPNGCIPEIASYIVNNNLRASHSFKKYKTPFHLIVEYLAPSLDQSYALRIRNNPFHENEGIIKIMDQSWNRIDQIFMGIQKYYYAAHAAGLKDATVGTITNDNEMQELVAQNNSRYENLAEKVNRTILLKKFRLTPDEAKKISQNLVLPQQYLDIAEKFIDDLTLVDEDDHMKQVYELLFSTFEIKDETDICNINISQLTTKITSTQGNDKMASFKKVVDAICNQIYKNVFSVQSYNQQQKLRKLIITLLIYRMKAVLCKNVKYDAL